MDAAVALKEADKIAEIAREEADTTEAGHRLAPAVVDALDASGLRSWWLPTELGGLGGDPVTMLEMVIRIAAGDASAGWCAGIGLGANAMAALLDRDAATEMFAGAPGGIGVFSPTGRLVPNGDDYDLAGRWPFSSNCQQAQWGAVGYMRFDGDRPVMGEGGPVTGLAFLRRDQFEIDENWDMAGLRGTGSHDITATTTTDDAHLSDLFAPRWSHDALFRMRMFDLLGPALGVVPFGIGRAALDAAMAHIEATGDLPQRGPKPPFGVDTIGQAEFARVDSRLRMAKEFELDQINVAYEHALRGEPTPREVTARIAIGLHEGLDAATAAVNLAVQIIGTAAFREGSYIDRLRRDIQAVACHVLFHPANLAPLGRQAAGMHTVAWPFLPPDE